MKFINKTKYLFLVLAFFAFCNSAIAQSAEKDCFEVKYFDFFGISSEEKINWSDDELNELLKRNYSQNENSAGFLIPIIVFQLKSFHPNCNQSTNAEQFNKLVSLYFKVLGKDVLILKDKAIAAQLNFIREDFYKQLQDERMLIRMLYTTDDGPLYGEIPERVPKSKSIEMTAADFGKLSIIVSNSRIFLIATDKRNKKIWVRIMKGTNPDRYLRNLKFDKDSIEKTSLATIVHFYSEGERLNLYLKPNGKFICYFHSW